MQSSQENRGQSEESGPCSCCQVVPLQVTQPLTVFDSLFWTKCLVAWGSKWEEWPSSLYELHTFSLRTVDVTPPARSQLASLGSSRWNETVQLLVLMLKQSLAPVNCSRPPDTLRMNQSVGVSHHMWHFGSGQTLRPSRNESDMK